MQLPLFTTSSPVPRAPVPTRLAGYVLWHGVSCHHESEYSIRCAVAFVVGVYLARGARGRPPFSARQAHRECRVAR